MNNLRKYGKPPYTVAVLHGGPGAPGEVAPVARELSSITGVLEPLQTKNSLDGQVSELHEVLTQYAQLPLILIGFSWGAMLGYIFTARYQDMVQKLILIGSGPFEQHYADAIDAVRFDRMTESERVEALELIEKIHDTSCTEKDIPMARVGAIFARVDCYDPLPDIPSETLEFSEEINRKVWADAKALRVSGKLLEMGRKIACPVIGVHGDYDPHPVAGVTETLPKVLRDFRFILLEKCGHEPWLERYARDKFYRILREEIA